MQGNIKPNLLEKVAGAYQSRKNACRNLTRLIKRTPGATLPIDIDVCLVHVRLRKPSRSKQLYWPIISLSSWCKYLLQHKPPLILGGHDLSGDWKESFKSFWRNYKVVCPDHPIYNDDGCDSGLCIPYFVHGDEGRGQLRRPYMVVSIQFAIGHGGIETINDNSNLDFIS